MATIKSEVKPPSWASHQLPSLVGKDYLEFMAMTPPDMKVFDKAWRDDVTRNRGISIIQDMLSDARVSQASDLKKSAVINVGFDVIIDTDIVKDRKKKSELEKFVIYAFDVVRGSRYEFLKNILSAFDFGYSFNVMTLKVVEAGVFKDKWVCDYITPVVPTFYKLKFDDAGHISHLESQSFLNKGTAMDEKARVIPLDRVIYMKIGNNFNSPYGKSQITKVFEAWWNKKILRRMRNSAMDRFGSPFMVGKVAPNTEEARRKELLKSLSTMSIESVAVIDNNETIEAVNSGGLAGIDAFQQALAFEDKEIVAGIAGSTLNVMEGGSQGSYAQARVHQDNFLYSVQELIQILEDVVNEQFIKRLVEYNYGKEIAEAVRVKWRSASDPQVDMFTARFQTVGSQVIDINDPREKAWIRKILDYPDMPKPYIFDQQGNVLDPDTKEMLMNASQASMLGISDPNAQAAQEDPNAMQQDPNAMAGGEEGYEDPNAMEQEEPQEEESPWWMQEQEQYTPPNRSYAAAPRYNPMKLKKKTTVVKRRGNVGIR